MSELRYFLKTQNFSRFELFFEMNATYSFNPCKLLNNPEIDQKQRNLNSFLSLKCIVIQLTLHFSQSEIAF